MYGFTHVGTHETKVCPRRPCPSSVSLYTKLNLYGRGETSVTMVWTGRRRPGQKCMDGTWRRDNSLPAEVRAVCELRPTAAA